ncbi:hypothetical protein [Bosea vaviloviae]|uniref:Uncharacterized protein n=1 Tax=Bosea vaviloviae TaxID=1526658 RepID=A0A1D7TX73_9HYPH|nr:hypothetical protein [Bosea vaviloviae]AOO79725.1 hypothetical protein BHK69_03825 [Bosea vaviloviae]
MSRDVSSILLGTVRSHWPAVAALAKAAGRTASAAVDRSRPRLARFSLARFGLVRVGLVRVGLARFDGVTALIRCADAIETGFAMLLRGAFAAFGRRGSGLSLGLGLTGGLVWRGLAALTGIGLTASLITALSAAGDSEPRLASLTIPAASESRPVRDVLLEPRQQALIGDNWLKITRPIATFGLESPELDRQQPTYEAMRSQDGARRQDTLSFGAFDADKPHLRLRLLVTHNNEARPQPFVIALVREASERGMSIQRSGVPTSIETRFGTVETADTTLSDGDASRPCIAFRKSAGDLPLGLSGWWCGAPGRPADRQQLVCLIDRIDLLAAGEDKALRSAFSRTELARQPTCAPPRLSATGRKASWLDADATAPALRTRSAAAEPGKPSSKR